MWSCDSCGADVEGRRILCPHCGNGAPFADAEQVRLALQRDLVMEAHLRALGVWYRIGAVAGGVLALWMIIGFGVLSTHVGSGAWGAGVGFLAGAMIWVGAFVLAFSVGSWLLGHHLARYVNGARITAGVLAIAGLALVALRTVVGIIAVNRVQQMLSVYGEYASRAAPSMLGIVVYFVLASLWTIAVIWALLSRRSAHVCTPAYRTLVLRTPELTPPTFKSPFFVLPLAAMSLAFLFAVVAMIPRF